MNPHMKQNALTVALAVFVSLGTGMGTDQGETGGLYKEDIRSAEPDTKGKMQE